MQKYRNSQMREAKGFTLVEVLVTTAIISTVTIMLLRLFVYCSSLAEMAGNMTAAMTKAEDKMEEIKNYTYSSIAADYASGGAVGNTFNLSSPTGKGVIYIDSSNANLLEITIDVSWRNKDSRIMGEDADLDGAIDTGEDVNGNGQLDSVVKIVSKIAQR